MTAKYLEAASTTTKTNAGSRKEMIVLERGIANDADEEEDDASVPTNKSHEGLRT